MHKSWQNSTIEENSTHEDLPLTKDMLKGAERREVIFLSGRDLW